MPIVTPHAGQIGGRSSASGLDLLLRGRAIDDKLASTAPPEERTMGIELEQTTYER